MTTLLSLLKSTFENQFLDEKLVFLLLQWPTFIFNFNKIDLNPVTIAGEWFRMLDKYTVHAICKYVYVVLSTHMFPLNKTTTTLYTKNVITSQSPETGIYTDCPIFPSLHQLSPKFLYHSLNYCQARSNYLPDSYISPQ